MLAVCQQKKKKKKDGREGSSERNWETLGKEEEGQRLLGGKKKVTLLRLG